MKIFENICEDNSLTNVKYSDFYQDDQPESSVFLASRKWVFSYYYRCDYQWWSDTVIFR